MIRARPEAVPALAAFAASVLLGCGGKGEPTEAQTQPFRAAIVEYLRVGTMDMKPDSFKSLDVQGDRATAVVRMATKDDLYGMKPEWTFTFGKDAEGRWKVTDVKR